MVITNKEKFNVLEPSEKKYLCEKTGYEIFEKAYIPLSFTLDRCEEKYMEVDEAPEKIEEEIEEN